MELVFRDRPPSDPRHRLALEGERAAEDHLRAAGYRILARRFLCKIGEIDLVAEDGPVLVFVEVKTRSRSDYADPWESVNRRKQRRIQRAALVWLQRHRAADRRCRFDVVDVVGPAGGPFRIRHIPAAFDAG